jgi:polysaccharide chain length determinant protein (PEP-CTERM system associated)
MPLTARELNLNDYIGILRRRFLVILALAIGGGTGGYMAAHYLPKRYTSQTVVLVQQPTVPGEYVRPVVSQDVTQRMAAMQQQILSRTRLEPIIQQFGLYQKAAAHVPADQLVDNLRKAITVSPVSSMAGTGGGLPGFTVGVTLDDAHLAQQVCSSITSMFMEKNLQLRQEQAEDTTEFLGKQLEEAKAKLDDQDSKLAEFKRHYIGSLPDEEQANFNILVGLTSQLEATRDGLNRAQQDKTYYESVLSQQLAAVQANPGGSNPDALEQQLATLEQSLEVLRSKYTDNYPDVIKTRHDIAILKQTIAGAEKPNASQPDKSERVIEPAQVHQLREQLRQLDEAIKERTTQQEEIQKKINVYESRVQAVPAVEQEYKEITRDYQTALDFYTDLLRKRSQSAMATDLERRQEGEQFLVLDPANLPERPSFPNNRLFAFGGFGGGLGLGLALSYFLEMQDTSIRSERDVESELRLPVLAMIPTINGKPSKAKGQILSLGSPGAKARVG